MARSAAGEEAMSDEARLRVLLDAGLVARRSRAGRARIVMALVLALAACVTSAIAPSRWWIFVIPMGVLPFLPRRQREDELVRLALLDCPTDVFEITHHRGQPTVGFGTGGLAVGAISSAIRSATRDRFYVWIQVVSGAYASVVLDEELGEELLELIAARCPHVAVRHGLPSGMSGLVVE
jgi:hypothetical protein